MGLIKLMKMKKCYMYEYVPITTWSHVKIECALCLVKFISHFDLKLHGCSFLSSDVFMWVYSHHAHLFGTIKIGHCLVRYQTCDISVRSPFFGGLTCFKLKSLSGIIFILFEKNDQAWDLCLYEKKDHPDKKKLMLYIVYQNVVHHLDMIDCVVNDQSMMPDTKNDFSFSNSRSFKNSFTILTGIFLNFDMVLVLVICFFFSWFYFSLRVFFVRSLAYHQCIMTTLIIFWFGTKMIFFNSGVFHILIYKY